MTLPALPTDVVDEDGDDALLQQFYIAAQTNQSSTGNTSLDTLLQKGLYGKRMPKALKGQKAADSFQSAFDLIGGVPRLALWADKNPTAFYALYSKLIPSSVKTDITAKVIIEAPWMKSDRLSYGRADDIVDIEPKDK